MDGFFKTSKVLSKEPVNTNRLAKCSSCGLNRSCDTPQMPVAGQGRKKILLVAESPSKKEDERGKQLNGKATKVLKKLLSDLNVSLEKDCWKTNSIICHPFDKAPDNKLINACAPHLFKTIKKLQPTTIILLGSVATQSLIGTICDKSIPKRGLYTGWQIPLQRLNAWVCPTYHPQYLMYAEDAVIENLMREHLRAAIKLSKKHPYKNVPQYLKDIDIIIRPKKAIPFINDVMNSGKMFAFDYETNCLKPEYEGSLLYSCSICYGNKKTIAFPWHECIVEPLQQLFKSKAPKIAANMKFEDRWTRNKINTKIRKWSWDTMLAAHILDNRKGITGLKFQSLVQLGQESYDDHIKPLLKNKGKKHINRIHEIDMGDLLLYNGMDSLLTYRLAKIQMKKLGVEL